MTARDDSNLVNQNKSRPASGRFTPVSIRRARRRDRRGMCCGFAGFVEA